MAVSRRGIFAKTYWGFTDGSGIYTMVHSIDSNMTIVGSHQVPIVRLRLLSQVKVVESG
ncbi:hypothetical protein N9007_01670 [bacterium]|nr:hypothetical protein [bacterium]